MGTRRFRLTESIASKAPTHRKFSHLKKPVRLEAQQAEHWSTPEQGAQPPTE